MKFASVRALTCLLSILPCLGAAESPVDRPMIWVNASDRASILAKIESQPWAQAAYAAMKARVEDAVVQHQRDPDAFLRGLPLVANPAGPEYHPTLARIGGDMASTEMSRRDTRLQHYLQIGTDCGVLYYLTQDEAYARCAADILHAAVEAMVLMSPSDEAKNGGLIYPGDHLYEARALGPLLPVIYDFVYGHLKAGAPVYNLVSRQLRPFDFAHAQQVFRCYVRLGLEHGIIDCNWPVLEMPSVAHNALAIDDPRERGRLLEQVLITGTAHQDSLKRVLAQFAAPGAVWPESIQYSGGVASLTTYLVALMRRQEASSWLTDNYANIPLTLHRLNDFRFPNGEYIRFGDGPRRASESYHAYEIAYALGRSEGDAELQKIFGELINLGVAQGRYDRARPQGPAGGASVYLGPLQLLWFAPDVAGQPPAAAPRTTDELPFAGVVLQRNLTPDHAAANALMAVVSGGHYVHGHASGMALELYGAGQVLGPNAGKGVYTTDEHENYRRLFAAYNTVIVNGVSRSDGGWVNLGINNVEKLATEPAIGALPVSPNHSFTLTRFVDDRGDGAKARQERLVGVVRTSGSTGYYVDVFRSRSARPEQFHDYLYHNLGDAVELFAANRPLSLVASPGRFVPVAGATWVRNHTYLFPGWHVFDSAQTSAPTVDDVMVQFSAKKLLPKPARMRLFILGGAGREYSSALAPVTKEAPPPYDKAPTPVLVIRQQGEAWTRPFAVIYEPSTGPDGSGAIGSVTALTQGGIFAGFRVALTIRGRAVTQLVLVLPSADSVFEDAVLGLRLVGRYAVITLDEREQCTALYLGEGEHLSFKGIELVSGPGRVTAASVQIDANHPLLTSTSPAFLTLPDGRRLTSARPGSLP